MKKSLFILSVILVVLASCRSKSRQIQVVEEEIEYRPLVTDSAAIDSISNSGMVDNDAVMEYPDIPKDGSINMSATDDEVMDIISGAGDGDLTKE